MQVDAMLSRFAAATWGDCVTVQVNNKLHKISAASLREHSVLFETMLDSTADTSKPLPLGFDVEDVCFDAIVPFLHTGPLGVKLAALVLRLLGLAGSLDCRMVTDAQFVRIAKLAEYLDAKALLDHLRGILSANFDELVKMKDFTSKDISYRVMHRLLEGFTGKEDDRLTILAHWLRDWDGDRTDTRIVGTLYPLMRSVDLSKVSEGVLANAHRMMPAAAFGLLDASAMYMRKEGKLVQQDLCDVTRTQGSGIPAGIGADSGKFRLWTRIPGIRDCRRGVPLGRYSGCSHGYSAPKKSAHARGFRSWEVRACRGERQEEEEEEAEQVQALRRAFVGHPVVYPGAHGLHPRMEVQQKYGKCAKLNDPGNSVLREEYPREHDARGGREEGRQVARRDPAAVG